MCQADNTYKLLKPVNIGYVIIVVIKLVFCWFWVKQWLKDLNLVSKI